MVRFTAKELSLYYNISDITVWKTLLHLQGFYKVAVIKPKTSVFIVFRIKIQKRLESSEKCLEITMC